MLVLIQRRNFMSLIKCTECGKEFSDKAAACPNCACPTEIVIREVERNRANDLLQNGCVFPPNPARMLFAGGQECFFAVQRNGDVNVFANADGVSKRVGGWNDVESICYSDDIGLIALKKDGTVMLDRSYASGSWRKTEGLDELLQWNGIKEISVSTRCYHNKIIVALKDDGTVLSCVPFEKDIDWRGQRSIDSLKEVLKEVSLWRDIVSIETIDTDVVGLKADGSVVATGVLGEIVSVWEDIVQIKALNSTANSKKQALFGLKTDGTVECSCSGVWWESVGSQIVLDTDTWGRVIKLETGDKNVFALTDDGKVLSTGENYGSTDKWADIVDIAVGGGRVIGLRRDGTVASSYSELRYIHLKDDDCIWWENIVKVFCLGIGFAVGVTPLGRVYTSQCFNHYKMEAYFPDIRTWDVDAIQNSAATRKNSTPTSPGRRINRNDEYYPEEVSLADYVNDAFGGDWQMFEDNKPSDW
jgi:hypothetical protein